MKLIHTLISFFFCFSAWSQALPQINITPGQVTLIKVEAKYFPDYRFHCLGQTYPITEWQGQAVVFLAVPYDLKSVKGDCSVSSEKNKETIKVATPLWIKKDYPQESLEVQKEKLVLSKKNLKRVLAERSLLNAAYDQNGPLLFNLAFEKPVEATISSHYGKQRIYNKFKKSPHLGTDFKTTTGTEIFASNRGKVVLVSDLFFTGNTVILWHGSTIFSVYAHLSKTNVKENDLVERGQLLGLSGATGRVSGPHLHFGVKVEGEWVDGQSLIEASLELERDIQKTKSGDRR